MRILIGIPSYSGEIPIELVGSLFMIALNTKFELSIMFTERTLVERARNVLAKQAIDENYDYLLFIDDDMVPPEDVVDVFVKAGKDVICAPYPDRVRGAQLQVFKNGRLKEVPKLMQIDKCGMGCTLIKTRVLSRLYMKHCGRPFEFHKEIKDGKTEHFGEDTMFCERAVKEGFEIWCTPEVRPVHIGKPVGFQYKK